MEINFRGFFQDFNASKFVVYFTLLIFTVLLALRQDGSIFWPYWVVFFPLWIWKIIAIVGAIMGFVVHCKHPPARTDVTSELEFRSMILCFGETLLLLMFEVFACYKLESGTKDVGWCLVFVPLLFVSLVSIVVSIWSVKRGRNFEFELFFGVNVLQFVFVALKLDAYVTWGWVVIFVPLWMLICVSLIGVMYAIVLAILFIRSIDLLPEYRRQHLYAAMEYTFLVIPVLIFLVLLTKKLDGQNEQVPYVMVCLPLYISLLCLIFMACGTRGGNQWWFGIRKDFCHWLLDAFPLLREYGNVSYRFSQSRHESMEQFNNNRRHHGAAPTKQDLIRETKPVAPIITIECPD